MTYLYKPKYIIKNNIESYKNVKFKNDQIFILDYKDIEVMNYQIIDYKLSYGYYIDYVYDTK